MSSVVEKLRQLPIDPEFRPSAFYNRDGDTLEVYLRREPYVVERISSMISAFVSESDPNQIVGLAIKNIAKHFGEDPNLRFLFQAGRATIRLLVMGTMVQQDWQYVRRGIKPDAVPQDRKQRLEQLLLDDVGNVEFDLPELVLN
jgi:hypothetical protein